MYKKQVVSAVVAIMFLIGSVYSAQAAPPEPIGPVEISAAVFSDVSAPVSSLTGDAPTASTGKEKKEKPIRVLPNMGNALNQPDGALQTSTTGPAVATSSGLNFAGVGNGDYGFVPNAAPPDTNGAVGATQYVQWVNSSFAVFNKSTGAIVAGFPKAGNSIWAGFGGGCQTNNDGDPIVQYDKAANRWVLTQFSVSTTPFLQCVAVSTTSDATGTYNRYAFSYGNTQFNDYPKMGVWSDGYYVSYNIFNNGTTFAGSKACAFDRAKMLAGDPSATQQCFQLSSSFGGLLPTDLDGSTAPPAGSPNFFMNFGANSLNLWKFHADFANSANSTFTGPTNIPVASFSPACSGGGTCIPQAGTTQQLDSLADRLMYRLAYRNFGDHEALVVNHSVTAGTSAGIRWYEIRNLNGAASVFQSGTYAPDSSFRWMGSIAMDKVGNIALGYSVSSASLNPAIRYTGRAPADALGTLQAENSLQVGGGSQLSNLSRWGDYSAMTIDPTDDCTFFYTTQYLKTSGTFNWSTRIASFKFPSCTTSPPVLTTITVSPTSASVATGGTQQFTATGLDQFNQPVSPQPAFTWSVSGGGTISTSGLFTAGTTAGGPFTVKATSGSLSGSASVTVTAPPVLTTITISPASASVLTGGTQQFTAAGRDQFGNLMSPQPAFTWAVSGGGTISTSGLFTAGATAGGPFTVTASSSSVSGIASVTVTAITNVIKNGNFETGNLTSWTATGTTGVVSTGAHSGTFAARLGSTAPTNGNSSIVQTFTAPTGAPKLTFWYNVTCPDTVTFDWATATLRDNTTATTFTILPKTCTNGAGWKQVNATLTASHSYTLTLTNRDDNFAGDATFTLYDDVTAQ